MGGTMYEAIMKHTVDVPFVRSYFAGELDRETFKRDVKVRSEELAACGLDAWQTDLLRRMPVSETAAVAQLGDALEKAGVVESFVPRDEAYAEYRTRIHSDFSHLTHRFTSIFPEEGRIAYELSCALKPKRIVVAGSYYAFLAVWMIPGLQPVGTMDCIDPDREVSDLAEKNMITLGFSDRVRVRPDDAVRILGEGDGIIDILVVDAYGPATNNDPEYHGKSIYGPIVRAALPRMRPGSVVMAHNADRESSSLDGFFDALKHTAWRVFLDTTEHLAVFGL